jgi:hypothetical protein
MANKKLLYNENGTNAEIANSGSLPSVYFDDTTNTLVAQGLVINKVTASIGSANGILGTDANGKLTTISTASATSGQYLQSDGTNWAFRNATGVATGDYLPGSDLSGSLSAPIVISIRNVVSGTLSASYGGTGVSSFTSGGLLVKDSTNTLKFVRPDAGASVLRPDGSGSWYSGGATGTGAYSVQATYFTCSNPLTSSTYLWTKPSNHRNVKVILMGGGGGGGGGSAEGTETTGRGGGAGGFSVYDLYCDQTLTASITIGAGGIGGQGRLTAPGYGVDGAAGAVTTFSSSYTSVYYFAAFGGNGGGRGGSGLARTQADDGFGNISNSRIGIASGAGGGGAGGGPNPTGAPTAGFAAISGNTNKIIGFTTASAGTTGNPGIPGGGATTSIGIPNFYSFVGGGGGAGSPAANGGRGGNGIYGSGGGGQGGNTSPAPAATRNNGGSGGDGYAIIISW